MQITVAALFVGAAQIFFFINVIRSLRKGEPAGSNPWGATTLEWQTPDTPPRHGNWGATLPVVYRWAYDYSVPGAAQDFLPQNFPPQGSSSPSQPSVEKESFSLQPPSIPPTPEPEPDQEPGS